MVDVVRKIITKMNSKNNYVLENMTELQTYKKQEAQTVAASPSGAAVVTLEIWVALSGGLQRECQIRNTRS